MSRDVPRTRHPVPRPVILLLAPIYRFSHTRSAYVLRLVGERFGPVLTAPAPRERRRDRPST